MAKKNKVVQNYLKKCNAADRAWELFADMLTDAGEAGILQPDKKEFKAQANLAKLKKMVKPTFSR